MSYYAVMAHYATLNRIASIAQDQWGLITRRQAEHAGVSPATLQRLASESVLERVAQGVYRLSGFPDPGPPRAPWCVAAARA